MGLRDKVFGSARDRFGDEVARQIRTYDVITEAVYQPAEFRVAIKRRDEDSVSFVNLGNTFSECDGVPADERSRRIAILAEAAGGPLKPDTWDEVRPKLRPVPRPIGFAADAPKPMLRRPAMPFLGEFVVIDLPTSMAFVSEDSAAEWGVSTDEVFAAARANLAGTAARILDGVEPGPKMIRFVEDGDGYFASLPLIDGWLAGMGAKFGTRPLAFITKNDGLLLAPESPNLDKLLNLVLDEYREGVRQISPVAYTVDDDGRVIAYDVPRDHPSWPAVHRAQALLAANAYAAQTKRLTEEYEIELIDAYVSSLQHFSNPSGIEFTVATWTPGIVSHLPLADYVAFRDDERDDTLLVPWAAVAAEVGFVPLEGHEPPRYEVGDWPAREVMERLFAQAESP